MKPSRIILLLVALVAGGLAAFLATRGDRPAPQQITEVVEEARTQILVAKQPIGVAERLNLENVEWIDWPEGAVRPEYVTIAAMPDAPAQLAGTVARFEFFAGEPIREQKLVRSDQGYLSAVLAKGKRGVSIGVSAFSSSGGFIVPNDHVDVVLTRQAPTGEVSETILSNVKVLAIGQRLGEVGGTGAPADPENPRAEVFSDQTIATLELDPAQGETLINSAAIGSLSLVLRSIADFNQVGETRRSANQAIRVIRYGEEASVMSGNSAPVTPEPAAVETAQVVVQPAIPVAPVPIEAPPPATVAPPPPPAVAPPPPPPPAQ